MDIDKAEETFLKFLNREEQPADYEHQLLVEQYPRVKAILEGKVVPPYELEIQPTSTCNVACEHCLGRCYPRLPNTMHSHELKEIARKIDGFRENGFRIETVKFCGTTGEPLVNPITLEGITLFKNMNKKVIVFTNGLFLDMLTQTGFYYDHLLQADKINISLDAGSEEIFEQIKKRKGFNRTIQGVYNLISKRGAEHKPNVVISYVIGQHNYVDILKATKIARAAKADEIRFRVDFTDPNHVHELSDIIINSIDEAKKLATDKFKVVSVYTKKEIHDDDSAFQAEGRRCFNHHFWASIGPDCNLYACGHRTHSQVQSYGSLLENSFMDLWLSAERQENTAQLPDHHCTICSPSSLRRNDFMTFLAQLPVEKVAELVKKYIHKA